MIFISHFFFEPYIIVKYVDWFYIRLMRLKVDERQWQEQIGKKGEDKEQVMRDQSSYNESVSILVSRNENMFQHIRQVLQKQCITCFSSVFCVSQHSAFWRRRCVLPAASLISFLEESMLFCKADRSSLLFALLISICWFSERIMSFIVVAARLPRITALVLHAWTVANWAAAVALSSSICFNRASAAAISSASFRTARITSLFAILRVLNDSYHCFQVC